MGAARGIPVGEFVKGKVVVVTGSGGGIGRDMARVMAAHGAHVVVNDVSKVPGTENIGQANYSAAKIGIVGLSKSIALDMEKFNVRSNCIAPWAWTPMTATIPDTPENAPRIAKMKKMESAKIAPLAVYLISDSAAHVSGQIFGVRANEIYFFSQIRMHRSVHRSEGWTPESIAEHAMPAFEQSFYPNVASLKLTPWDPI